MKMENLPARVIPLLKVFGTHKLILIEWEISLFNRLGYPLSPLGDLFFLLPDDQLHTAVSLAADLGFHSTDSMNAKYTSESSGCAIRYIIDHCKEETSINISPEKRLVLLPLSWTGISRDDIIQVPDANLPCCIYTIPFHTACVSLVQIACRERRGSMLRSNVLDELCGLITYRFFDMSYEGDYMEILTDDVPRTEKEIAEMNNAVVQIENWELRQDVAWIKDALVRIVKGEASYDNLPFAEDVVEERESKNC